MSFVATLFNEGKTHEAESVFVAARTARPKYPLVPRWAAEFAYQRGDLETVARIADSAAHESGAGAADLGRHTPRRSGAASRPRRRL